jgi:hypothetical protein
VKHICKKFINNPENKIETCADCKRIKEIELQLLDIASELYSLVGPSKEELDGLESDLEDNPHVYSSYLIQDGTGDRLWIARTIAEDREEENTMQSATYDS